jgi:hypothetical protein
MSRVLLALLLFGVLGSPAVAKAFHPVPRVIVDGSLVPICVGKTRPPWEEWNVILSSEDLIRDRYNSDFGFPVAKQDTRSVARFCFQFFRIQLENGRSPD